MMLATALWATAVVAATTAVAAAPAIIASSPSAVGTGTAAEWSAFKRAHNKSYGSAALERHRRAVYEANAAYITHHNALFTMQGRDLRLGVNEFSDLSSSEFGAKYAASSLPQVAQNEDSSTGAVPQYNWLHVPRPLSQPNACGLFQVNGSSYVGGNVVGFSVLPNNEACCTACAGNPACQHYNYKKTGKACTLYSTVTKLQEEPETCSGSKTDPSVTDWVKAGAVTP
jgi:hypothetical protein